MLRKGKVMVCLYRYKGIPLTQYCRDTGLPYNSVYNKIMDGMAIEEAVEYAIKNKGKKSHCKLQINGVGLVEYLEKNYKRPISAYLRYAKLKCEGYNIEEIMKHIERFK